MPRWIAPGVAVMACVWLLLVLAAPMLWIPASAVLYAAGALICHQLPDRSFHVQGFQLPVCARCFGLYGGGACGSIVGATAAARSWVLRGRRLLHASLRWKWTAVAAIPTIATFVLEWGFGWPMSNATRAIAALPLGFIVAFVVVSALATVNYE